MDGVNIRGATPCWESSMELLNKITLMYVVEDVYLLILLNIKTINP